MGITIRGNGLRANTPRRMGKANVLSPEIKNKAVADELVTVTLNRKQIKDLRQLLKIEADHLGGRPDTEFIARKYDAIRKSIERQS